MEKDSNNKTGIIKVCETMISPPHKLEVTVVGCGGTGSQVLQGLARMELALESLGHPGLYVTAYDDDIVEEQNIGRQLFSFSDVGKNKAACLVSKINRFYGFQWEFIPRRYKFEREIKSGRMNVLITCVDNVATRKGVHKVFKNTRSFSDFTRYWMDFGNGNNSGQVVLGSTYNQEGIRLFSIGDLGIPKKDDPETPSCSLSEALDKQDLMINPMIANTGLSMLWRMFRTLKVTQNIAFLNLEKMKMISTLKFITR